tara:strand:- start:43 stop:543 length:501 start_codon:yes stop_codon:yes gene_type:complete
MLTQEILREYFKYEPQTGHFFWNKQTAKNNRNLIDPISCRDKYGYVVVGSVLSGKFKNYRVHRLIWVYVHGQITHEIDHINGIRDDNRLCNLREVTHQQNMMNRVRNKSKNQLRGIYKAKGKTPSWAAEITHQGVKHYLGVFKTPEEANFAYEKARAELFKEFART